MNIFLPYENDIQKSVQSLDDLRLNKQILECYQLLSNVIKEENGEEIKGYKTHPIYVHYKNQVQFLFEYGMCCCAEYNYRFNKTHKLNYAFPYLMIGIPKRFSLKYIPFYMEGSKGQPNFIRTTENVSFLFQSKLIKKWENDKKPPKWTNRGMPSFYKSFLTAREMLISLGTIKEKDNDI